jgi:hypothetical protein
MAIYEMGVFQPFQKIFGEDCPETEYCPYGENDLIFEDKYGNSLRERSLDEVIGCLDWYIAMNDPEVYERDRPLIALLNEYQRIQNNWYRLAVLHYGH